MSAKRRRRFETRTILIVLFIIVVIAAVYVLITNLPAEGDYVTPEEVILNKSKYLDQTIVVRGYYDIDGGNPVIVSTMSTTAGRSILKFDYSNVDNATDKLFVGKTKYDFTGVLRKDESNPIVLDVILVLEKFEDV